VYHRLIVPGLEFGVVASVCGLLESAAGLANFEMVEILDSMLGKSI